MRFRFSSDDELDVLNTMCNATPDRCKWGCGDQCAHPAPNESANETFAAVASRFLSRRSFLVGGAAAAGFVAMKATPMGAIVTGNGVAQALGTTGLGFTPIALDSADQVKVASGYTSKVLIRWGDPLTLDTPGFDIDNFSPESQLTSFGYNCDYVGFQPLSDKYGLLVVNHEYTNPELMFRGYDENNPTQDQVDIELAAHGITVVTVERKASIGWRYVIGAWHNRRVHAKTPMRFTGPAAGHALLRTSADPAGERVLGMLNNCSAGLTPWGTVLTCEENFNQYFANNDLVADKATQDAHKRYGLTPTASSRKWERFYDRFDLAKEPTEAYRFGWVVEIDPHNPNLAPKKHTALGRFKHEATSTVIAKGGQAVVYMGDDERFDYMYKFVSANTYIGADRLANFNLLETGTLYVAKFNDDGTGRWIPLVHGQNGLTAANGFRDQGEVSVKTRQAGDRVGATKMDRPEDIEVNPVNGKIYAVMTNNTRRGTGTNPGVDGPNPRADNKHGHIIEITPDGGDHAANTFRWGFLIICGDPAVDKGTFWSNADPAMVSPISSPDNITFDQKGNLWISTDGQTGTFKKNDGVYAVPTEGPEKGYVRQFFSGVPGGECASLCFDNRDETLFVSIQHPAEDSDLSAPSSTFPDGREPRPSVVFVMKAGGGTIGS
ncbi:MAG: PhoX family phosphatase [Dehalococcoidia bacterium]